MKIIALFQTTEGITPTCGGEPSIRGISVRGRSHKWHAPHRKIHLRNKATNYLYLHLRIRLGNLRIGKSIMLEGLLREVSIPSKQSTVPHSAR